jgi:hypothetical protein
MIYIGFLTSQLRLPPLVVRAYRWSTKPLRWVPLTTQSTALLLLALYLLAGPVRGSSDIVSAALAFGLLAVVTLITLLVLAQGIHFRSRPLLAVTTPTSDSYSNKSVRLVVSVAPARILPGFYLECHLDIAHQGASPSSLRISGASRLERKLHLDITFPHRGSWEIHGLRCHLRDSSGLAQVSWTIPQRAAIIIEPPRVRDSHLPLLSSTQRPGDLVTDTFNRQGDPFDIKPYHPSDGVKKIVWKAFAKSGELLSRHPEASMTPEGFVTIMVLARPEDDDLCGKATAYVRALKELQLDVVVGCEGAGSRDVANDASSCQKLLVDSVWDAAHSTPTSRIADTQAILDYCAQSTLKIAVRKMIIFVSGARVSDSGEAKHIEELAQWLTTCGIEPVFCLSEPQSLEVELATGLRQRAFALFVAPPTRTRPVTSATRYRAFLSRCLTKQWEVFV